MCIDSEEGEEQIYCRFAIDLLDVRYQISDAERGGGRRSPPLICGCIDSEEGKEQIYCRFAIDLLDSRFQISDPERVEAAGALCLLSAGAFIRRRGRSRSIADLQ